MQQHSKYISQYIPNLEMKTLQQPAEDYSKLLVQYGADYYGVDYYWHVGTTTHIQGWILHISVIAPQISDLLHKVIPVLLTRKVPFKLPQDRDTARHILDGNLGYEQLGQVISMYPDNAEQALELARQLVKLTQSYKGPVIPTDIHLGGTVYTRYGGINPVMRQGSNGEIEKYIYNVTGELVKDTCSIPFQLPPGIAWPFDDIASPEVPKPSKNLRNIYRPLTILKPDARGNVTKALYVKGFLRLGTCVIKAGKKSMLADDMGRDIRDRLIWQKYLHEELGETVRLPKILDFFEENGDIHLVMEFIKGKSLHDGLVEINGNQISWFQLTIEGQIQILDWLFKILTIIARLHQKGFVHRDIAPGNFMIDPKDEIVLIDTELMYDLKNEKKEKPFELGTPGFMSPEQEAISIPTIKEDIYGLGALMINMFTCLSASRFDTKDPLALYENLAFFIRNDEIAKLICACLSQNPSERPSIHYIQTTLADFKKGLAVIHKPSQKEDNFINNRHPDTLRITIKEALAGLSQQPMPIIDGIWFSKTIKANDDKSTVQKEHAPYAGIRTGMTGVLYLLARAKKMGYDLASNKYEYKQSWKYIYQEYLKKPETLQQGLYNGAAGIALTLTEGIDADLLEDSELIRDYIQQCLEKPNEQLNIAEGVAGQALALLQCNSYMKEETNKRLLDNCILQLLRHQNKNGSWNIKSINTSKQYNMPISWSHGISGIIFILLLYNSRFKNKQVQQALNKSLTYLRQRTHDLKGLFIPSTYQKLLDGRPEIGDERISAIFCFIQAYEILKDPYFKEAAEEALYQFPAFVVNNNLSQDGGLAAFGETYLEAWRIFKNEEWKKRAWQIASVFLHTIYRSRPGSCYWLMDETRKPAADLFTGNSGIIHFLLRCDNHNTLGHILLQ